MTVILQKGQPVSWQTKPGPRRYGAVWCFVPAGHTPSCRGMDPDRMSDTLHRARTYQHVRPQRSYVLEEAGTGKLWWPPAKTIKPFNRPLAEMPGLKPTRPKIKLPAPEVPAAPKPEELKQQEVKILTIKPRRPDYRDDLISLFQIASAGSRSLVERETATALYLRLYNALWSLEQPKEALEHSTKPHPRP
jgi:hypothetical protein